MKRIVQLLYSCALLTVGITPANADTVFCDWETVAGVPDTRMNIVLRDGTLVEDVLGIRRDFCQTRTGLVQGIRLQYISGDSVRDSVYRVNDVVRYSSGGIGGTHAPLSRNILPVREFQKVDEITPMMNVVDANATISYAGPDDSQREIGADNLLYGVKANVSPFGGLLGQQLTPAIQLGAVGESGRWRLLLGGQFRYNLISGREIVDTIKYYPNACNFAFPGKNIPVHPASNDYEEVSSYGERDSTAILLREKGEYTTGFRLDAYAEAGTMFNTDFEGAGRSPAVNEDDYGQWYAGVGVMATFDWFFVGLGYSYYKLSVRTPCENCQDLFLVNTNDTHTVELRLGYALWWR